MRASAAALLIFLAVAGCGGDSDETAPETTQPLGTPVTGTLDGGFAETLTTEVSMRCESAGSELTTPLANGIEPEGLRLIDAYVVKSGDHDSIYFVSAEIDGLGYENEGDIATWASTSRYGGELIYAVDELANELSTLRDGKQVAGLSVNDDGVAVSRDCAA